jgi:protein-tyrosine-phosphatase
LFAQVIFAARQAQKPFSNKWSKTRDSTKNLKSIQRALLRIMLANLPIKRMQAHAKKRGYNLNSISRKFNPNHDFDHFDMIIAMDDEHIFSLKRRARNDDDLQKIHKMTDFRRKWITMKYQTLLRGRRRI